jgi:hypothetical protein
MSDIAKMLDELSFLSRETNGASFSIIHNKEGLWRVNFTNCMVTLRNDPIKDYMELDKALETAINYIRARRKQIEVPLERYTMY